jgi:hypothetical protein
MKKGYWVNAYRSISDESALKAYVDSLEAAHTRRQQFQSQIECSLRALVKARGGQDFQMLARRRDARWLTQLDSKWVLFDKLIEDPKVSAEEALRVLAASEEIEKQGQG